MSEKLLTHHSSLITHHSSLILMDFNLSKPQRLLKESAREFLARECGPDRVRALMETDTAHDERLWRAMAEQGWTARSETGCGWRKLPRYQKPHR